MFRRIHGNEGYYRMECPVVDYWVGRMCFTIRRNPNGKINQIRFLWSGRFGLSLNLLWR